MLRRSAALLRIVGLLLALLAPARAAEERLQWDAPVGCPGVEGVHAAVASALGAKDFDLGSFRSIRGRVDRHGAEWQLSLELVDAERRRARVIVAPTCSDVVQAAGVAIALALDAEPTPPDAALEAQPAEPLPTLLVAEPETAPVTPVQDVNADALPTSTTVAPTTSLRPTFGAAVVLDGAALHSVGWGMEVSGGVVLAKLQLLAYGLSLPGQRTAFAGGGAMQLQLLTAGLRARYVLARAALDVASYAGLELGRLSARGVALEEPREFHDRWLTPELGLELSRGLSTGFSIAARAGAVVPLLREKYSIDDQLVHRPAPIGVRAALTLSWEWQ
jgi:hypothetical protein